MQRFALLLKIENLFFIEWIKILISIEFRIYKGFATLFVTGHTKLMHYLYITKN